MADPILELENLKVYFNVGGGFLKKKDVVKAVDGISLKFILVKLLVLLENQVVGNQQQVVQLLKSINQQKVEFLLMEKILQKSKVQI